MVAHGRDRGRVGTLHAGFNVLVPKPYTPYSREAMVTRKEARRRMRLIEDRITGIANIRVSRPGYREAQWQAYLSRGDSSVFSALEDAADGLSLGGLLAAHRESVDVSTLNHIGGDPIWQFISSAPIRR